MDVALRTAVKMRWQDNEKLGPGPPIAQRLGDQLSKVGLSRAFVMESVNLDREKIPTCLYYSLNGM